MSETYLWDDFWKDICNFIKAKIALGTTATERQISEAAMKIMEAKYSNNGTSQANGLKLLTVWAFSEDYSESIARLGGYEILEGGRFAMLRQKTVRALYDLVVESGVLQPTQQQVESVLKKYLEQPEGYLDKGIGQN